MSEDRKKILGMLKDGKISVAEADELLSALGSDSAPAQDETQVEKSTRTPKYLRVEVNGDDGEGKEKVNIRVPLALLRAGVKIGAIMPKHAREEVDSAFHQHGFPINLDNLDPRQIETLIAALSDLTVDVEKEGKKVRVFCE